ncbi:MAG: cytochrome P450 [Verrucomicrobiota bacterium]|jgi:cytochrome P450|nr:cytochrome P450 [Verrucomicrobiota bacterium]
MTIELKTAPGPQGHWFLGIIPEFRKDILGFLVSSSHRYGNVVRFKVGPFIFHLVNHPDLIRNVLQDNRDNYTKNTRSSKYLKGICGESLLTSNGDFWRTQRQLVQPAFHRNILPGYAQAMADCTTTHMARWGHIDRKGETLNMVPEVMELTFTVVARVLFGADLTGKAAGLCKLMDVLTDHAYARNQQAIPIPLWVPTSSNLNFKKAFYEITAVADEVIASKRRQLQKHPEDNDLLSLLIREKSNTTDTQHHQLLRNEVITFFLGGYETTANSILWTLYLLAKHQDTQDRVRMEINQVLNGTQPEMEELEKMPFTRNVWWESLRMYPTIWVVDRFVHEDDMIGGFHIPKKSNIVISPFCLHRHPEFWDEPDDFKPERFGDEMPEAFMPFGAGARFCVGHEFAKMESMIILSMLLKRFKFTLDGGDSIRPAPSITLRLGPALPLKIERMD